MDERLRLIARVLEGERMSDVCREFSISRKTGYKLRKRYRDEGPIALCDRSRRPVRYEPAAGTKCHLCLKSGIQCFGSLCCCNAGSIGKVLATCVATRLRILVFTSERFLTDGRRILGKNLDSLFSLVFDGLLLGGHLR